MFAYYQNVTYICIVKIKTTIKYSNHETLDETD